MIDGRVAFTGGAGISDWWATSYKGQPPWRDTMFRVEGPIVAACQAVFAENWIECRGDIPAGDAWFPPLEPCGTTTACVVRILRLSPALERCCRPSSNARRGRFG